MSSPAVTRVEKLLLAAPRGYCAGVDRAVQTVERALERYGPPVYVRKEIVHNKHVVEQLRARGAVFVEEETEVPEGSVTVFSAHGVAPSVHRNAAARGLQTIDATCPLVTKVHVEAKKFAAEGYTIVLIGHDGHEEVEGTMGEAPDSIVLVETEADVDALEVEDPEKVAMISQTTLSVDETAAIIARLRQKFPNIASPRTDDICYATTNRQAAVKQMAEHCDLVLVIGSRNSSNSQRLVEVARDYGAEAHLIDNEDEVREEWLEDKRVVGISSGASAPEELVQRLVGYFRERGVEDVEEFSVIQEDVRFMLPDDPRQLSSTLLLSDLHLGTHTHADVLRRPAALERLTASLEGVERVVLLGDAVELRSGPARLALAAARPVMEALAGALEGRELVLVPGNHDHALIAPWLERRVEALGLEQRIAPKHASAAAAELLAPFACAELAYPGIWVRDDVYAMHGHYLDAHVTVPSFERLAVGVMGRVHGAGATQAHRAEDYEALLAPIYAWIHATAQRGSRSANSGGGARIWKALAGEPSRRRSARLRAATAAFPLGIAALNRAGLGPLRSELSGGEIKRASLHAFAEVLEHLGVRAAHAIFGHTHRFGPLGAGAGWSTPAGVRLHNTGSWVYETSFMARAAPADPYWPGGAVLVAEDPAQPPAGLRLLGDLSYEELAAPASKQTP